MTITAGRQPQAAHAGDWSGQKLTIWRHREEAAAQFRLGLMYIEGKGVVRDEVEGFKWIAVAAGAGDTNAAGTLAGLRANWPREQITKGEIRAMDYLSRTNLPTGK